MTIESVDALIREAEAAGQDLVEIRFHRPAAIARGQTVRLFGGRGGPESCADTNIVEVEPQVYAAKWRVADLKLGVKQLIARNERKDAPRTGRKRGRPIQLRRY
jgi:hypothetical protein